MSRHVNKYMITPHTKLQDLNTSELWVSERIFQTSLDLTSMLAATIQGVMMICSPFPSLTYTNVTTPSPSLSLNTLNLIVFTSYKMTSRSSVLA